MPATTSSWKGKERALPSSESLMQLGREAGLERRDNSMQEGDGGADGVVLPLDMIGSGYYDVAYTIPVKFGQDNQQFSLQIDTGSSDMWVASTSCTTSTCKQTDGRLYDPNSSRSTGQNFVIHYLQGVVSGPIVWDKVEVGGYSINTQALAAANSVDSEPLGTKFSGILGLALPLNSIIATIPALRPVTNNAPDGAAWASNLFSITPTPEAPTSRFLSLSLARPGSDRVPSLLGIGRHPSALVQDPSEINYSTLVSDRPGTLFWKATLRGITVYVNGQPKTIEIGRSNTGAVFPSAVLDSGVPLILTTSTIANAIYGAIGVSPASDGTYYVPCTQPLNMTFTLDDRPEIPIHPLDITAEPPTDDKAKFCIGLIQTADDQLTRPDASIGDMILGVPFLRNTYTVMAYTPPDDDGTFSSTGDRTNPLNGNILPRLGLLSLTDPTTALKEFNTVRVLNQPISSSGGASSSPTNTGSDSNTKTVNVKNAKPLSVGVIVVIAIASFIAFCGISWVLRWLYQRRRYGWRGGPGPSASVTAFEHELIGGMTLDQKAAYQLARGSSFRGSTIATDTRGSAIYPFTDVKAGHKKDEGSFSGTTMNSNSTKVEMEYVGYGSPEGDEFGFRRKRASLDRNNEKVADDAEDSGRGTLGVKTLVGISRGGKDYEPVSPNEEHRRTYSNASTSSTTSVPENARLVHARQYSEFSPPSTTYALPAVDPSHRPTPSVSLPLLAGHRHMDSTTSDDTQTIPSNAYVVPESNQQPYSAFPDQHDEHVRPSSLIRQDVQRNETPIEDDDLKELEELGVSSMAGIGSAGRTSKFLDIAPTFRDNNHTLPYQHQHHLSTSTASAYQPADIKNTLSSNRESALSGLSYVSDNTSINQCIVSADIENVVFHSDLIKKLSEEHLTQVALDTHPTTAHNSTRGTST